MTRDPDEELLETGKPGRGIVSGALGVLVTLAVVIVVAVWLATRGSSPAPSASSPALSSPALSSPALSSPAPSASLPTQPSFGSTDALTVPAGPAISRPRTAANPTGCPGDCETTLDVPSHLVVVVRTYFPAATGKFGYTVVRTSGSPGLWYRQLHAYIGPATLDVVVRKHASAADRPASGDDVISGRSIGFARSRTAGYVVEVRLDAARSAPSSLGALRRLAADPRVTELP